VSHVRRRARVCRVTSRRPGSRMLEVLSARVEECNVVEKEEGVGFVLEQ
jgi:hypothetical protein